MAFLKQEDSENEGVCDNCGTALDDAEDPIEDDGDGHEFCSTDCRDEYAEDHEHEDEGEENVCQFC